MSIPSAGVVFVDGVPHSPREATVSVFDRGFLYGDAVFEVVRTYGGRPYGLREHLERLSRSAARLAFALPLDPDALIAEIERAIATAGFAESYVRIVVTRGSGPLGLDPDLGGAPTRVVIVQELTLPPAEVYRDGVSVLIVESMRATDGTAAEGAKTSNYLANLLALREAKAQGCFEPVFARRGASGLEVLEGSTSNVFVIEGSGRERTLLTPEQHVLSGITRGNILAVAPHQGYRVACAPVPLARFLAADEACLTSTVREVVPIVRVVHEGVSHLVGAGRPGPLVRALHRGFRELVGASVTRMPWE